MQVDYGNIEMKPFQDQNVEEMKFYLNENYKPKLRIKRTFSMLVANNEEDWKEVEKRQKIQEKNSSLPIFGFSTSMDSGSFKGNQDPNFTELKETGIKIPYNQKYNFILI
jgi:hypothetical protein